MQQAVRKLASSVTVTGSDQKIHALPCNVACSESLDQLFRSDLPNVLGDDQRLDCLVHSLAYATPESMKDNSGKGRSGLLHCSADAFLTAHNISSYSLIELTRRALPFLTRFSNDDEVPPRAGASIVALSYLGATKAVPNYNIMGPAKASLEAITRGLALELGPEHNIRVNCVSAGPINTLAARGIRDFHAMKRDVELRSPLRRGVTAEEVGNTVAFLVSDEGSGITGQTVYVDAGYSAVAGPTSTCT